MTTLAQSIYPSPLHRPTPSRSMMVDTHNMIPPEPKSFFEDEEDSPVQTFGRFKLPAASTTVNHKKSMSFHRHRPSKKSGTILRAVPEITVIAPVIDAPQQDSTTQHSNNSSLSMTQDNASENRPRSSGNSSRSTLKSFASTSALKGAIGTYKHGKVQWQQKNSSHKMLGSIRSHKPKIQVVIPSKKNQVPTAGNPPASAAAVLDTIYDVSPPSGTKGLQMRESLVSPMVQQQNQRPIPQITTQIPTPSMKFSHHHSSSSDESQGESDTSSVYSNGESNTSVESTSPPMPQSKWPSPNPNSAPAAPVADSPPRRYGPHHPRIEDDMEFKPTCEHNPVSRPSSRLSRTRTVTRKSSVASSRSISLSSARNMGIIDEALHRSASKQMSTRAPSPTLSEAADDLVQELSSNQPASNSKKHVHHLTSFLEENPFMWDDVVARKDSTRAKFGVMSPVGTPRMDSPTLNNDSIPSPPAPRVPRRSSKRKSSIYTDSVRLSRVPGLQRGHSMRISQGLTIKIPEYKRMTSDDFILTPLNLTPKNARRTITPEVAEGVLLTILQNMDNLDDLFSTAIANRGFFRVFKRHELELMKGTLHKMSAPAWEHREICFPGYDLLHDEDLEMVRPQEEYTAKTYFQYHTRDVYILEEIKTLVKQKCQSLLRPEILSALTSTKKAESARVDNALWRIWTFCKIFGSDKGREEDIVAQMDWLKGGTLVHQNTCTYSILSTDYMNDTLAGAPECFGKGNQGGLNAEELFDIMELWNCLGMLLQPFQGRTVQAREFGVYDDTEVRGGDIDGEEMMLDEWCYYLQTLGLSEILELAVPCQKADRSAFKLAAEKGWVHWKAPVQGGTRRNFLKEATSRLYEEKIAATYAESSNKELQRALTKQRIQKHISELRLRKTSGERLAVVRMSQERPMSEWDTVINNLTRPRPPPLPTNDLVSHISAQRSPAAAPQQLKITVPELPAARTPPPPGSQSPVRRMVAEPLLPTPPPSTAASTWSRSRTNTIVSMPPIEEHPAFRAARRAAATAELPTHDQPAIPNPNPASAHHHARHGSGSSTGSSSNGSEHPAHQQHPLQRELIEGDVTVNSADRAVYRIVEMGFTPDQARQALRMTDLGDGLRVDRAVEMLLSQGL